VTTVLLVGAALHVLEALELRRRLRAIPALPAPPAGDLGPEVEVVTGRGAAVDERTRAAGSHEMATAGLDVLDLVPGDLEVEPALRLLRRVNPDRPLGPDTTAWPGGAHAALLIGPATVERMAAIPSEPQSRAAMVRLTRRAQRMARGSFGIRVAPAVRGGRRDGADRWAEVEALTDFTDPYVHLAPAVVTAEALQLAALAAGAWIAPVPGLLTLAAWCAKPVLVFGGSPAAGTMRPQGIAAASLLRLPRAVANSATTMIAGRHAVRAERTRAAGREVPAAPPEHERFEPRRATCPWCEAGELEPLIDTPDLLQHKPGSFHLDRCRACGHVFQNPALSVAGLDYYYDQFYTGAGGQFMDTVFGGFAHHDSQRIAAVAAVAEPKTWLDVGTGPGLFCARARERWPAARFDGLDMSESVEEARLCGAIDTAYRGFFPDLVPELPDDYDVVSMHHYLENTRDPRAELDAATAVLATGGHLMIEVPDPESPWAARLGRWWVPWFQPQRQHLIPCANLIAALEERGFEVVSVERSGASIVPDLSGVVLFAMQTVARSPHLPWLPPVSPARRAVRPVALTAALPAAVVAQAIDRLKDARLKPDDIGDAYRIVARKGLAVDDS
jgi:SAM-dependent methyltransferase